LLLIILIKIYFGFFGYPTFKKKTLVG